MNSRLTDESAFATVSFLSERLRDGSITSSALVELYLARIKRFDPHLNSYVTVLRDHALAAAAKADDDAAQGKWGASFMAYHSPLKTSSSTTAIEPHGVQWHSMTAFLITRRP